MNNVTFNNIVRYEYIITGYFTGIIKLRLRIDIVGFDFGITAD